MIVPTDRQFRTLAEIAQREAGLHFPADKKAILAARLQRRLREMGLGDIATYLRLLAEDDPAGRRERDGLVCALTTNVTSPWREPHHFLALAEELRRRTVAGVASRTPLRIWSAGCSTGAEVLSIATTCRHVLGPRWTDRVAILGTDVNGRVLAEAAEAVARAPAAGMVPDGPFAIRPNRDWCAPPGDAVTVRQHNLLDPPPEPGRFDVVFCRNVSIYFHPDARAHAHGYLREALSPKGLLFLGHSERLDPACHALSPEGRTTFRAPVDHRMAAGR
ncbi:MAG: protein-glutamate O-methyltransferase CheR [Pseudomonadota bacterium]